MHSHNRSFVSQRCCFLYNQVEHFARDYCVNKNEDNIIIEKEENSGNKLVAKIIQLLQANLEGCRIMLSATIVDNKGIFLVHKCPSAALFCRLEQPTQESPANQLDFRPSSVCQERTGGRNPSKSNCAGH